MLNNTGQIECPSCHTLNDPEECFCVECGVRSVPPNSAHDPPVPMVVPEVNEQERASEELAFAPVPVQAQDAELANEVDIFVKVPKDVIGDHAIGELRKEMPSPL